MAWLFVALTLVQHPSVAVDILYLSSDDPGRREAALVRICNFGTLGEMPRLLPLTRYLAEEAGDARLRAGCREITDILEGCLLLDTRRRAAEQDRSFVVRLRGRDWFVDRTRLEPIASEGEGARRGDEPLPASPELFLNILTGGSRRRRKGRPDDGPSGPAGERLGRQPLRRVTTVFASPVMVRGHRACLPLVARTDR